MKVFNTKLLIVAALSVFSTGAVLLWPGAMPAQLGIQPEMQAQAPVLREFKLIAQETNWQLTPEQMYEAWTYNGTVPGPEIRVKEGDLVRITL